MINEGFSIGKIYAQIKTLPNLKFRDKEFSDIIVHDASAAASCHRQITYKKLGYTPSNPTDFFGNFKMSLGSWIERGLNYELFSKGALFGMFDCGGQGGAGEHQTFYGTSWHGFRDRDVIVKDNATNKFLIVELKTKMGNGAEYLIKESAWSKNFKTPMPDTQWGQAQQLSLYLRDAYIKTKDNPKFKQPITDGVLLLAMFSDVSKIAGFVEYYAEYKPETDTCVYYRVVCHEFPQCNANINVVISLKDIADRFAYQDSFLIKKELAPPEWQRKYDVNDPRVLDTKKTELTKATKNDTLIGDMFCKYCAFKDKCAEDLNIKLDYTDAEIKTLKNILSQK